MRDYGEAKERKRESRRRRGLDGQMDGWMDG